jgi:hypothetical protein
MLTPAREEDLHTLYEEMIGPTRSTTEGDQDKPFFVQAAEARAAKLGTSTEQLLSRYSEQLRDSNYPTANCLTPDEVRSYVSSSSLSDAHEQHLAICDGCKNLLEAAEPPREVVLALLEDVRLIAAHASGRTRAVAAGAKWNPTTEAAIRASALFAK